MASRIRSDIMSSGMLDLSRGRRSGLAMGLGLAAAVLTNARARVIAMVAKVFILDTVMVNVRDLVFFGSSKKSRALKTVKKALGSSFKGPVLEVLL